MICFIPVQTSWNYDYTSDLWSVILLELTSVKLVESTRTTRQVFSILSLTEGHLVVFIVCPALSSLSFLLVFQLMLFSFQLTFGSCFLKIAVRCYTARSQIFLACLGLAWLSSWMRCVHTKIPQAMCLISQKQCVPQQRTDQEMLVVLFRLVQSCWRLPLAYDLRELWGCTLFVSFRALTTLVLLLHYAVNNLPTLDLLALCGWSCVCVSWLPDHNQD
jgi:hypothetical protein